LDLVSFTQNIWKTLTISPGEIAMRVNCLNNSRLFDVPNFLHLSTIKSTNTWCILQELQSLVTISHFITFAHELGSHFGLITRDGWQNLYAFYPRTSNLPIVGQFCVDEDYRGIYSG
jgi:hypothetical protein